MAVPAHDRLRTKLQLLQLKGSLLTWYAASIAYIYRGTHRPDGQRLTLRPLSFLEQRALFMCLRVNIIGATRGGAIEYLDAPPQKASSPSPAHDRRRNDLQFQNVKMLPLKGSLLTWYAASMARTYCGTYPLD